MWRQSVVRRTWTKRQTNNTKQPDVIIVGGGSAGCVLASRLSEDPEVQVVLLEAGARDRGQWDSWKIQMPAALTYNLSGRSRYNWNYVTTPQSQLNDRRLSWPRGRVLGGSSSLNAMVYIRGHARDYDHWEALGAQGWSYSDCLPYFQKAQCHGRCWWGRVIILLFEYIYIYILSRETSLGGVDSDIQLNIIFRYSQP